MTSDESIGLIAGGTGITPMLQVAQRIVENEHDATKVSLIFANVRDEDILLRSKIEELAAAHPRQLKVYYVLDEPPEGWKGGKGYLTIEMLAAPPALHASAHHGAPALFPTGKGYLTKEMLAAHLPPPSGGPLTKVLLCGPPGMVR
jgi:cytochrome-b5 reductase